jgi:hypothetical protein
MASEEQNGAGAGAGGDQGTAAASATAAFTTGGEAAAAAADAAGAAAAAGGGAGAGGEGGGADPEWFGKLSSTAEGESASNLDYAKSKGWKSMDDVLKSYRDAEKGLRDSGRVKVPGDDATAEERAAWNKTIGVPDDIAGYAVEAPLMADGKPAELNSALLDRLAKTAFERGMPAAAYKAVLGDFLKAQIEEVAGLDSEQRAAGDAWVKAQGAASSEKLASIDRAVELLGFSQKDIVGMRNVVGAAKLMDAFARIGAGVREDTLHGAARTSFGLSATEARAELSRLRQDSAWVAKVMVPGSAENLQ